MVSENVDSATRAWRFIGTTLRRRQDQTEAPELFQGKGQTGPVDNAQGPPVLL